MSQKGYITGFTGPMFSGKTTELLRNYERRILAREKSLLFKPIIDQRYETKKVKTHFGYGYEAYCVEDSEELYDLIEGLKDKTQEYSIVNSKLEKIIVDTNLKNIFIDETQFFDSKLIETLFLITDENINVYWTGLNQDYRGLPFYFRDKKDHIGTLMALSDEIISTKAVCSICGKDATRTYRRTGGGEIIEIGGIELYEARCPEHHSYDYEK